MKWFDVLEIRSNYVDNQATFVLFCGMMLDYMIKYYRNEKIIRNVCAIILKSHVLFSFSIAYFLLNVALLSDECVNAENTIESITN